MYHVLKAHKLFKTPDADFIKLVAEVACCSTISVQSIIESETDVVTDEREEHTVNRIITQEDKGDFRMATVSKIKEGLTQDVPVFLKNLKAWATRR